CLSTVFHLAPPPFPKDRVCAAAAPFAAASGCRRRIWSALREKTAPRWRHLAPRPIRGPYCPPDHLFPSTPASGVAPPPTSPGRCWCPPRGARRYRAARTRQRRLEVLLAASSPTTSASPASDRNRPRHSPSRWRLRGHPSRQTPRLNSGLLS